MQYNTNLDKSQHGLVLKFIIQSTANESNASFSGGAGASIDCL